MQILLFSATFDDTVKRFAMKVVAGANQVRAHAGCAPFCTVTLDGLLMVVEIFSVPASTVIAPPPQVFVPKEELSLDVIKQYTVVSLQVLHRWETHRRIF